MSLGTFLFVAAGAAYLWRRNRPLDRALACLFLIIALMQLLEFFLWRNLKCGPINRFLSFLIPVVLILQPILTFLVMWKFDAGWAPYYKELFYGYLIMFVPLLFDFKDSLKGGCVTLDKYGHLAWPEGAYKMNTLTNSLYWYGVGYSYGTLKNPWLAVTLLAFHSLSNRALKVIYEKSWPSMYCHFVSVAVLLGIALN